MIENRFQVGGANLIPFIVDVKKKIIGWIVEEINKIRKPVDFLKLVELEGYLIRKAGGWKQRKVDFLEVVKL